MVGADAALPLPWLREPLARALAMRSHALLLQGPQGVGQFELAITLAQAWLCESRASGEEGDAAMRPCGCCASCRLVQAHSHPDLLVLMPDALREALGWGAPEGDDDGGGGEKAGKAKPSKDIKVDAVRAVVAFAQTSSARGRCKVAVLHPAERMNAIAANALLKTLEEPAGDARFVLSCAAPQALLPTIRSRCQVVALGTPAASLAGPWLESRGIAQPAVMLAACGGQALDVLEWAKTGVNADAWVRVPAELAQGRVAPFSGWPLPRLIEALQKLCHDMLCRASDMPPRFFPADALPDLAPGIPALTAWASGLARRARRAEHPWNAVLATEALVQEAAQVLHSSASGERSPHGESLHSAA